MSGTVKTYDPRKLTLALGTHIITGYAEDSHVSIEANGDGISSVSGCDGEIARSIDPNRTYIVKISLLQTSASNEFLQSQYNYDRETGLGILPILVKDLSGAMVFSSESAWVAKPASRSYGKAQTNRDWEISTGEGILTEG